MDWLSGTHKLASPISRPDTLQKLRKAVTENMRDIPNDTLISLRKS